MRPEVLERIRAMKRASQVARAGLWHAADAIDRVVLDADERHRRRIVLTTEGGTRFLLDLPHATALRDGDGLMLEDGSVVRVVGKSEPLVEIAGERLRIRRDSVLEEMLRGLGAQLSFIEAPFQPEPGAYGHAHRQDAHEP